jgi:hypothetical protein
MIEVYEYSGRETASILRARLVCVDEGISPDDLDEYAESRGGDFAVEIVDA